MRWHVSLRLRGCTLGWHNEDKDKVDRKRWARIRIEVLDRDKWRCVACGRRGRLEVDHVLPMSQGGAVFDLENLQVLCRADHLAKTAKENEIAVEGPERAEWRAYVG